MKPISDANMRAEFEEIRSQMEVSSGGRHISDQDVIGMICHATKRSGGQMEYANAMRLLRSVAPFAEPNEVAVIRTQLPNFVMATPRPMSNYIHYGR